MKNKTTKEQLPLICTGRIRIPNSRAIENIKRILEFTL